MPVASFSMSEAIAFAPAAARSEAPSGCDAHPDRSSERVACARDFRHFLRHWHFINRETGVVQRFVELWPGQEHAVTAMHDYPWLYLLKAGKLGFTELECAFDGWRALFGGPNARVHLFSKDGKASKELLTMVRFGLVHLPDWLGLPIMDDAPGGDTTTEMKLLGGPDDTRRVVSYAAVKNAAIDQTATHSHVDELARMAFPDATWSSVESTVAPGGTVHIVSRGAGDGNFASDLYWKAKQGGSPLHAHFEPWDARPRTPVGAVPEGADPTAAFYAEREASMLPHELNWFLPRSEEDALKGLAEGAYIPEPIWLACYDPELPPLLPGDRSPLVIGLDAGVTNDCFAAVAVGRHPLREADPAVREVQVWAPPPGGGQIDYNEVERWLRLVCTGGCVMGHPNRPLGWKVGDPALSAVPGCEACADGQRFERFNVVQIAYDAYQLVDMAQRLTRERIVWCEAFSQGGERLEADALLRLLAVQRRLAHRNSSVLNEHIANANAKITAGEDSRMRIVKRNPAGKVDAAVACSMATARALYLNLRNPRTP